MDKVFSGVGKLWNQTKTTFMEGAEVVSNGVSDLIEKDVHDPKFIDLEKDLKNIEIVAKKNIEAAGVLGKTILKCSFYSIKIANEFVQALASDKQAQTEALGNLAAAQKSDNQFHQLCDNIIPQYLQQPFVRIQESLKEIKKLKREAHSYLAEKEKLEKKVSDPKNGNRFTADLQKADADYAQAYAALKPKVDVLKGQLLDASKKAVKASIFYFGEFIKIVDGMQQPAQAQNVAYPGLHDVPFVAYPDVDPQIHVDNPLPQVAGYGAEKPKAERVAMPA